MILSSSDILRVLGGDVIIRQEAKLAIVDGKPGIGTEDTVYIYVDKYPTVDEFEATWKIWVQDNSGMGEYVLKAMTVLLPSFDFAGGYYTTRDFASERTVVKTEAEKQLEKLEAERSEYKKGFEGLSESVQSRLKGVRDGIDGRDGKDGAQGLPGRDGKDGKDGRDGRDLVATEAELFDLNDVEQVLQLEPGQVLTWDGTKWTNLYVRQMSSVGAGGGGGINVEGAQDGQFLQYNGTTGEWEAVTVAPGGGVEEAPQDGGYYVRHNGQWIDLGTALGAYEGRDFDGGNFTDGTSDSIDNQDLDGGVFTP